MLVRARARCRARARPARVGAPLLLCGLLWFGAYNVALNSGERRVDAGTAAMLVNVGPILIAIVAGFVLHEGFPRALFAGCAVAFAGVVVIAARDLEPLARRRRACSCAWPPRSRTRRAVVAQKVGAAPVVAAADDLPLLRDRRDRVPAVRARSSRTSSGGAHGTSIGWLVYLGDRSRPRSAS